jgi:hypothetical protein
MGANVGRKLTGEAGQPHLGTEYPSATTIGPTFRPRNAAHGAFKQSDGDASNYGVWVSP